jgi:sulfide dehydrogenase cytochrome subunit
MKKITWSVGIGLAVLLVAANLQLSSCRKMDIKQENLNATNLAATETPSAIVLGQNLPGKELAANCFNCHGTNGFAGELKIASMSATEIISKINSFNTKAINADIMNVHASTTAYTAEEMNIIANFFAKQQ